MSRIGRGETYAALAAAGYGSAYVATSFALRSFDPLPAAVYRSLLAALALAILGLASRRARGRAAAASRAAASRVASPASAPRGLAQVTRPRAGRFLRLATIAVFGGPVFLLGMNLAVAMVGATVAAFVAGLYAVLAAVLAPFVLGERLPPRALLGFVVALAGTALLAELETGAPDLAGVGWGLVAAVAFSLFLVLSRKWSAADGFDGPTVALATMTAATLVLGVVEVSTAPPSAAVPLSSRTIVPEALVALAWLAFVAAAGQALAAASVRLIPASRSSAFLLLNPVVATVLAFVLLGERPSPVQLAGGLLVLAGIALATLPAVRRAPSRGSA